MLLLEQIVLCGAATKRERHSYLTIADMRLTLFGLCKLLHPMLPHPLALVPSPSQQPPRTTPKGCPCLSGSVVPFVLLVTGSSIQPCGISSLKQRTPVSLWTCTLHVGCGASLDTSASLLGEPENTSQLGKLVLTSAKKGLQLHCFLRGDLQSSPGSSKKEVEGH